MPRIDDTSLSFMCPPLASAPSSAWFAITASNARAYSSARRISPADCTHFPSSLKKFTRALLVAISPSSASCSPCKPTEIAPTGYTSAKPAARPSATTCSTIAAESATGSVLAIAHTAV